VVNGLLIFWLFFLVYVGIASETTASNNNNNNNFHTPNEFVKSNPQVYQIGGVLSSEESLANFTEIIVTVSCFLINSLLTCMVFGVIFAHLTISFSTAFKLKSSICTKRS